MPIIKVVSCKWQVASFGTALAIYKLLKTPTLSFFTITYCVISYHCLLFTFVFMEGVVRINKFLWLINYVK